MIGRLIVFLSVLVTFSCGSQGNKMSHDFSYILVRSGDVISTIESPVNRIVNSKEFTATLWHFYHKESVSGKFVFRSGQECLILTPGMFTAVGISGENVIVEYQFAPNYPDGHKLFYDDLFLPIPCPPGSQFIVSERFFIQQWFEDHGSYPGVSGA